MNFLSWLTLAWAFLIAFASVDRASMSPPTNPCASQCVGRDAFLEYYNGLPSACKQCIREECDPLDPSTNLPGFGSCVANTRGACDQCPEPPQEQLDGLARCRACRRPFQRRGGLFSRDGPRTPCPCIGPAVCFSREELRKYINSRPPNCRSCIVQACRSVDSRNHKAYENCVIQNALSCSGCPPPTPESSRRFERCRACTRRCDADPEFSCPLFCNSPGPCPTSGQIVATIKTFPQNCQDCIRRRCGYSGPNNQTEVTSCMYNARAECSVCVLSSSAQRQRRSCTECHTQCEARRDRPREMLTTMLPKRPTTSPQPPQRCSCFGNRRCPSSMATRSMMQNETNACRSCVSQNCGDVNRGRGPGFVSCVARTTQTCSGCSDRFRDCRRCFMQCPIRGVFQPRPAKPSRRPSPPRPPTQPRPPQPRPRPAKPSRRPSPPRPPTQPRPPQPRPRPAKPSRRPSPPRPPTQPRPPQPRPRPAKPSRRPSPPRPPTQPRPPQPRPRPAKPSRRPSRPRPPTQPRPPQPRPRPAKPSRRPSRPRPPTQPRPPQPRPQTREMACRSFCTTPNQCPSANQIIFAVRSGVKTECRNCIMRLCGGSEEGSISERADCMYQARAGCEQCTINEAAQQQRTRCSTCLTDCASRRGGNETSSSP